MKKILTMSGVILIVMGLLNILAGLDIIGGFSQIERLCGIIGGSMAIGMSIFIFWLLIKHGDKFID